MTSVFDVVPRELESSLSGMRVLRSQHQHRRRLVKTSTRHQSVARRYPCQASIITAESRDWAEPGVHERWYQGKPIAEVTN